MMWSLIFPVFIIKFVINFGLHVSLITLLVLIFKGIFSDNLKYCDASQVISYGPEEKIGKRTCINENENKLYEIKHCVRCELPLHIKSCVKSQLLFIQLNKMESLNKIVKKKSLSSESNINENLRMHFENFHSELNTQNEEKSFPFEYIRCIHLKKYWDSWKSSIKQQNDEKVLKLLSSLLIHYRSTEGLLCSDTFSNQQDPEKDKGVPLKDFLHRNRIENCSDSQLLSVPRNEGKLNKALPSNDFPHKYLEKKFFNSELISAKQQNDFSTKFNEAQPSNNFFSENHDASFSNSQLLAVQHNEGKLDKAFPPNEFLNKYFEKSCFNSELISTKQQNEEKLDEAQRSKNFFNKNHDERCSNSQLLAMQHNEGKFNEAFPPNEFLNKFFEKSCFNSELISSKQNEVKLDEAQPSENFFNENHDESCSNSQLLAMQQNEGKFDKALSPNDFLNKYLEQSSFNLELISTEQQNEKKFNEAQPSKSYLDENLDESCSNSQLLAKQQDERKSDEVLPSNDISSKSLKRYNFNFLLVFKQRNKRMKSTAFESKIKDNKGVQTFIDELLGEKIYTADVSFFCDENNAFLPADSTVLAAESKYFKDLLFGSICLERKLELNMSFCIFFNIIKWFYSGKIEFSDDITTMEVYQAAKYFKIQLLVDECLDYIQSMKITEHNIFSNLQLCNTMKIDELHRRCIQFLEENTFLVINTTEFLKSPFNLVRKICQLQCLSLTSEVEVLEALLKWLNFQPNLKKSTAKSLEISALKCVRFLSFSAEEFTDIMPKHSALFSPDESQNIFMYLLDPTPEDLKTLPAWCDRSQRTLLSYPKRIGTFPQSMDLEVEKIKIQLKASDVVQDISELTSILEMRCMNGIHQLNSIKLSFQPIENNECLLANLEVKIRDIPSKKILCSHRDKNLLLKNSEIKLDCLRGISVCESQVLQIEVSAKISQSNFLQFDKWFPKRDFDCFFLSKPIAGALYFISEVVYGPLGQ